MSLLDKNAPGVKQILTVIPDELLTQLAENSKVDYCAKFLHGKLMFYLLLYGLLKVDKLSQRGLSDIYGSSLFKTLFNIDGNRQVTHSSISDRLSSINLDFFEQSYEAIYKLLSQLYKEKEIQAFHLQRVDSSLVTEASQSLKEGLFCGNNKASKKKMIKYSMSFDGTFASLSHLHTENCYASEELAIPEAVREHFKKSKDHSVIYVFDRGVQSADTFSEFEKENICYVGRLLDTRKLEHVKDLLTETTDRHIAPGKTLLEDRLVKLYKITKYTDENGKKKQCRELVDNVVRVVKIHIEKTDTVISFITNNLTSSAFDISEFYRRRWDIEVFFRFLKQELNFSHLISMNSNGIQVMMYMTLIVAMLIMIYKRLNEVGGKTAKRRIGMELEELIAAIFVIKGGGDLKKAGLDPP